MIARHVTALHLGVVSQPKNVVVYREAPQIAIDQAFAMPERGRGGIQKIRNHEGATWP